MTQEILNNLFETNNITANEMVRIINFIQNYVLDLRTIYKHNIIRKESEYIIAVFRYNEIKFSNEDKDEKIKLETLLEKYVQKQKLLPPLELINKKLKELKIKKKDCAILIGVNESHFSKVLRGERKLTLDMITKLNKILNIESDFQ